MRSPPRVVSLAIGLFSFSLPTRETAPREEVLWCCSRLLERKRSKFLVRAFKGPKGKVRGMEGGSY